MDLYDLLACPSCRVGVQRDAGGLRCPQCQCQYPVIDGVPIMLPGGQYESVQHEADLQLADDYAPWVHRMILQSLTDAQIVLEAGSGNMRLDDPCIIRMDIKLTPFVDVVGDLHALPFLPDTLDYVFALAVFEHLRQPFVAADEIYRVLKPGGYVYAEANFVYPYHGYPHHYFNISIQGFQALFSRFTELKTGVAPYQMPGFALDFVLATYLRVFRPITRDEQALARCLRWALEHPLHDYDQQIDPAEAYRAAAGDFLIGVKQPTGRESVIPPVVLDIYASDPELQARFPNPLHVFEPDNILYWARTEGRLRYPALGLFFDQLPVFNKRSGPAAPLDRSAIHDLPPIPPPGRPWFRDDRRPSPTWASQSGGVHLLFRGWNLLYRTWLHVRRGEFRLIWMKARDLLTR